MDNTDKALEALKLGAESAAHYARDTASKVGATLRAKVAELADASSTSADDYLVSWNDTPVRQRIVDFVERATTEGGPDYVEPRYRIATFDNDGTLWSEHPAYFQLLFAMDAYKDALGASGEQPNDVGKAILNGDLEALAAIGKPALLEILSQTHAGMSTEAFDDAVREWLSAAQHPTLDRKIVDCTFAPMRELLEYLRANGIRTFIVSGGGIEFMRVFAEQTYGIPPDQVVGSCGETTYTVEDGTPTLVKQEKINLIDDKEGKPVGIHRFIGRRPLMAFGNSDGDFQMLEYTTAGSGSRLGGFVQHDDAEREFAYDRGATFGGLDRGLDEAKAHGWIVISMKDDWNRIYAD